MKNIKIITSILILITILCLNNEVQAKYTYSEIETAIKFNIDRTINEITIDVKSIENSNIGYEQYANSSHEINILYEIKTDSKLIEELLAEDILVKLDGNIIENVSKELILSRFDEENNIYEYLLIVKDIEGNGNLSVEIKENSIETKNTTVNSLYSYNTGITVDNISPSAVFSEERTESGCANVTISSNELIRTKDGWIISEDEMNISKEFPENVSYMIDIMDFAGNTTEVEINITVATYIELTYGSHNSNVGWSFGYGNYDIAGRDAALASAYNKTESLVFRIDGNIDKDFLQARAYVYSYWTNSLGYCSTTGITYCNGQNPSEDGWKSLTDEELALIEGVEYFQFGGAGINYSKQYDINGENPIPNNIAAKFPYGISGITLKLKDYSKYSVIYQIYIPEHGWLEPKYNGIETTMGTTSVMSAIRLAIIPNSELKDIYDFWNKDTGSMNM